MIKGLCHCGAVGWEFDGIPPKLTSCNCSICRRINGLWAYGTRATIRVTGPTDTYVQGDRSLAMHRCTTCGCTTHWMALEDSGDATRIAVNMRMADPAAYADIRIRRFDGADTWEFLD
jgi:hypothetical protein